MHYIKYLPISYAHSKMGAVPITDAHCNMDASWTLVHNMCTVNG